jgi:ribosomal protein S13
LPSARMSRAIDIIRGMRLMISIAVRGQESRRAAYCTGPRHSEFIS